MYCNVKVFCFIVFVYLYCNVGVYIFILNGDRHSHLFGHKWASPFIQKKKR